jgi:DNA mismatch endonuclease, patch repair protein
MNLRTESDRNKVRSSAPRALPPTAAVRRRMQRTRQYDTPAEIALRKVIHARGLRYRVDCQPIAGMRARADIVFTKARVAVFVDGCFWHSCPLHGTVPKRNHRWWIEKLEANRRRDESATVALEKEGWLVLRFWEHEDPTSAAEIVVETVHQRVTR